MRGYLRLLRRRLSTKKAKQREERRIIEIVGRSGISNTYRDTLFSMRPKRWKNGISPAPSIFNFPFPEPLKKVRR